MFLIRAHRAVRFSLFSCFFPSLQAWCPLNKVKVSSCAPTAQGKTYLRTAHGHQNSMAAALALPGCESQEAVAAATTTTITSPTGGGNGGGGLSGARRRWEVLGVDRHSVQRGRRPRQGIRPRRSINFIRFNRINSIQLNSIRIELNQSNNIES